MAYAHSAPKDPDILLIVDDNVINRAILAEIFKDAYQIEEAEDGIQALKKIENRREEICAILLDIVMPRLDGIGLLKILQEKKMMTKVPVFLVTADSDNQTTEQGYSLGVMDVIYKPVVPYIVRRRVDSIVELFRARRRLGDVVERQQAKLLQQAREMYKLSLGIVEALSTAIEFRSDESGEHVRRIHDITRFLLTHTEFGYGLTEGEIEQIALASIMHDVGKIAIPDAILHKPGRLTPEEYEIMKTHTVQGAKLLSQIPQLHDHAAYPYAYDIALHHHERYDGKGYPEGLKGEELSRWSQVVALADVYDALVSKRCYKNAYGFDTAVRMITEGECGTFHPKLLESFLKVESRLRQMYQKKED